MPLTIEEFREKVAADKKLPRDKCADPWADFAKEIDEHPIHNPERSDKRGK